MPFPCVHQEGLGVEGEMIQATFLPLVKRLVDAQKESAYNRDAIVSLSMSLLAYLRYCKCI